MTAIDAAAVAVPLGSGAPLGNPAAGGKGAALDRLVRLGFPVPTSAVVTADAYRAVARHPHLAPLLARLADPGVDVPADEVDAAFLAVPVPDAVGATITAAARAVGGGGALAVRSSATAEDTAAASFAGQYRSSLGVRGDDAVLRAVRLTWASLWHPAPRAYRALWGVPSDGIAMAVVLMRMVPARSAGVVFTVDPGGTPDVVRVEAVDGLGEALVSGERTPRVWLVPGPGEAPGAVRDAADLALRVERAFGVPQDVEWAYDGERVWVVQARPITTAADRPDGCDTPVDDSELTTSGIGETLPGVIPPLVWDSASVLVEEAFRGVLAALGALPAVDRPFVRRVRGRAALDVDLLRAAARAIPGGSEAEIERQYFGGPATRHERGGLRALRHGLRAAAVRRHAVLEADVVVAAVDEVVAGRPDLAPLPDADLLAYRGRLLALGERVMAVELAIAAAAVAAYQRLVDFLEPHIGAEADPVAQRVTAGAAAPASAPMYQAIFAGPTWAESGAAPPPVQPRSADAARADLERRLRSDPRWRRVRMLTGQVVDVRMHLLRTLVQDAAAGLARRERVKAALLLVGGEVRRVHLEVGSRLAARGALAEPGQVDLLRDRELGAALRGAPPPPVELAHRARRLVRQRADAPLPLRFTGTAPATPPTPVAGDHLSGWPASPGAHTARARAVADPADPSFADGEVLVAAATDAAWSPLFARAGAIVVERGGPLSHAAIVARELGVPAVLNVPGATAALDGRTVTVDGGTGTITVHRGENR